MMRAVSITNRGGRENNEDYVCHARVDEIWCFVVCDGLGGHSCGEVASELAAKAICAEFEKNPRITADAAKGYLTAASERLEEERMSDAARHNMSTTAVVLLTDGNTAVWAHVGDSRLYYIEQGDIKLVTDDHSIAFLEFRSGTITYDGIRRSPNQNKLLHCMGDAVSFEADTSAVMEIKKGDSFLLCTDGFWELVTEADMERTLRKSKSPKQWLEAMLAVLHKNETDYNDNYSAIAIMI